MPVARYVGEVRVGIVGSDQLQRFEGEAGAFERRLERIGVAVLGYAGDYQTHVASSTASSAVAHVSADAAKEPACAGRPSGETSGVRRSARAPQPTVCRTRRLG